MKSDRVPPIMPEIFDREMLRLARASATPIAAPLSEIILDLDQLRGEAEAGGHDTLAAAIRAAADAARSARSDEAAIEREWSRDWRPAPDRASTNFPWITTGIGRGR